MAELLVAIPGDLDAPTGGYAYARRLIAMLPEAGIAPKVVALPASFPFPHAADLAETARILAALPPALPLLVDGLAYGAMPPETIAAAGARPIVALVHHPLGMEEGLSESDAEGLLASERAALALATRVVVTSPYTGRMLAERFGVPRARIHVAPPGTEVPPSWVPPPPRCGRSPSPSNPVVAGFDIIGCPNRAGPTWGGGGDADPAALSSSPSGEGDHEKHGGGGAAPPWSIVRLLAVGAVTPRKGYHVLVRALAALADLPWCATIVGALDRAPAHADELRGLVRETGLEDRIALAGAVSAERLYARYAEADIVVSSSHFEGYGMVLAESLARGLPIVMARAGAADETVPDEAALKVAPGDAPALADALRAAIGDAALRARLARASREAGRLLPRWDDTTRVVAEAVAAASREVA